MATTQQVDNTFRERLSMAKDLPVLPQVHLQAMRIVADPRGDASRLYDLLKHDPSLAMKILKVANSAYYGFRNRIEALQTAIVMLGANEIMHLIAAASIIGCFEGDDFSDNFDRNKFWYHSAAVGAIANKLSSALNIPVMSDVYTGGLLHDIGEVVLAYYFADDYDKCLDYVEKEKVSFIEAERTLLGIDHAEIGAQVSAKWGLPDPLVQMIRFHHNPFDSAYQSVDVTLIHLANRIAKHFKVVATDSSTDGPLESDKAWEILQSRIWPKEFDVNAAIDLGEQIVEKTESYVSSMLSV